MATSGQLQGNGLTIGGRGSNFVFVNWQLAGQDYGRNVSAINWQMYFHFNGADAQLDNGYADVGPARRYANGGRVYNYAGNFSTRDLGISSGSFEIGHDGAGNANLYVAAGMTAYQSGRSEAGANWSLPTIPRDAYLTNLSQDITDEDNPWVEFSNAGGFGVNTWFEFPYLTGGTRYHQRNSVGSRFTWNLTESEKNTLRAVLANTNVATIRYVIETNKGSGGYGYDSRDRNYTIINGNPTFTDFDYTDTNTAVAAITGNNQILVQGKSTLTATVTSAKKMVANKQATSTSYTATIDGIVNTQPYSASSTVSLPIGAIAGSGDKTLSVRGTDSRGNSATSQKTITVLPYVTTDIVVVAERTNNFEDETTVTISGTFSRVRIGSTDKNSITASSLEYRKRQDGGSWGSWTPVTFSQSFGEFFADPVYLDLANGSVWDFEVHVSDKFETVTETFTVGRGVPIFMISDNQQAVGVNKFPEDDRALDVNGDIFMNNKKVLVDAGDTWVTPTYQNGWVDYDTTYNTMRYRKDSMGYVHLKGMIRNGTVNAAAMTLPAGHRPLRRYLVASICSSGLARIDIDTDGSVIMVNAATGWTTLDNISFKAEQ